MEHHGLSGFNIRNIQHLKTVLYLKTLKIGEDTLVMFLTFSRIFVSLNTLHLLEKVKMEENLV